VDFARRTVRLLFLQAPAPMALTKNGNTLAVWDISLDCECPACKKYVNLLDYPDFWDGRQLQAIEHHTPRTIGMEVICPECGHEFKVDCDH
jgi:Zn finger protein HypA/HybF involved in hydrogenase expression